MSLVTTWLQGIGLQYAVPIFVAAGIDNPSALAELDVTYFEALGVTDPEDRRKLFFLVQRIRMAVAQQNQKNSSGDHEANGTSKQVDAVLARTLGAGTIATIPLHQSNVRPVMQPSPLNTEVITVPSHNALSPSTRPRPSSLSPQKRTTEQSAAEPAHSNLSSPHYLQPPTSPPSQQQQQQQQPLPTHAMGFRKHQDRSFSDDDAETMALFGSGPTTTATSTTTGSNSYQLDDWNIDCAASSDVEDNHPVLTKQKQHLQHPRVLNPPYRSDNNNSTNNNIDGHPTTSAANYTTIATNTNNQNITTRRQSRRLQEKQRRLYQEQQQQQQQQHLLQARPHAQNGDYHKDHSDADADYDDNDEGADDVLFHDEDRWFNAQQGIYSFDADQLGTDLLNTDRAAASASLNNDKKSRSTSANRRAQSTSGMVRKGTQSNLSRPSTSSSTAAPAVVDNNYNNAKRKSALPASRRSALPHNTSAPVGNRMGKQSMTNASHGNSKKTMTPLTNSITTEPKVLSDRSRPTAITTMATNTSMAGINQKSPSRGRTSILPEGRSRSVSNERQNILSMGVGQTRAGIRSNHSTHTSTLSTIIDTNTTTSSLQQHSRVTIQGRKADNSFKAQIELLRTENEKEYQISYHPDVDTTSMNITQVAAEEEDMRIRVVVRKRPMSKSEIVAAGDIDVIHPFEYASFGRVLVYNPKTKVDLTKSVEAIPFCFDNVFDEKATNQSIYERTVRNLIPTLFEGQWASIFAYGQTGSGKTFTMMGSNATGNTSGGGSLEFNPSNLGLYYMAALDLFQAITTPGYEDFDIAVSLFEIYGGKLFDLLNDKNHIKCLEDSKGKVNFPGLTQHAVDTADELMDLIECGGRNRATGCTSRNSDSSRSHAVLQLHIQLQGKEHSRLTFIDLAGSERGADTATASRATRLEGSEINTSLLALKEVIRALAKGDSMVHVPFRGSKLTQVLKESFVGQHGRSVMIACVSPNIGNVETTLNTLRYADRVKERHSETGALPNTGVGGSGSGSNTTNVVAPPSQSSSSSLTQLLQNGSCQNSLGSNTSDVLDDLLSSPVPLQTDKKRYRQPINIAVRLPIVLSTNTSLP